MADGLMQVRIVREAVRKEAEDESTFMLNYLYRLLRALGSSGNDILSSVRVTVPLSEQAILEELNDFQNLSGGRTKAIRREPMSKGLLL
jgi:hypothetical protein